MFFQSLILVGSRQNTNNYLIKLSKKILGVEDYAKNPDYINVTEEEKQSIGITKIHYLKQVIYRKPYAAKGKIVEIIDAHKLTVQSQNALLKILEEPPADTIMILSVNNESKLLRTLVSRCITYQLFDKSAEIYSQNSSFQNLNILDKFSYISELSSTQDKKIRKEKFTKFIHELYISFFQNSNIEFNNKNKILKLIQNTIRKVNNNANFKLVLENLVVNLECLNSD